MRMTMTKTTITIWMIWLIYYDVLEDQERSAASGSVYVSQMLTLTEHMKQCDSICMLPIAAEDVDYCH